MSIYIEEIRLSRYDDRIIVSHFNGFECKDKDEYIVGEMPKEDIESSYIGALKHFFNESEVWNG